jgi:hypothetical protein
LATATGAFTPASLRSTLQNKVAVNTTSGNAGTESNLSPGQEKSIIGAITDGLKNVQNMNVTAQIVNIAGQASGTIFGGGSPLGKDLSTLARNIISPPSAQGSKVSPAAKP